MNFFDDKFFRLLILFLSLLLVVSSLVVPMVAADPGDDDDPDDGDPDDGDGGDDWPDDPDDSFPPIAVIDTISPNPVYEFDPIFFEGYGSDKDDVVVGFWWEIDGVLVNRNASFSLDSLEVGVHVVEFWVVNDRGVWSSADEVSVEVFANSAPSVPVIDGPGSSRVNSLVEYSFVSFDEEGDSIVFVVDWGDGVVDETSEDMLGHVYLESGSYVVRCKAVDEHGFESDWGSMDVSMPKTKTIKHSFLRSIINYLQQYSIFNQILRTLKT